MIPRRPVQCPNQRRRRSIPGRFPLPCPAPRHRTPPRRSVQPQTAPWHRRLVRAHVSHAPPNQVDRTSDSAIPAYRTILRHVAREPKARYGRSARSVSRFTNGVDPRRASSRWQVSARYDGWSSSSRVTTNRSRANGPCRLAKASQYPVSVVVRSSCSPSPGPQGRLRSRQSHSTARWQRLGSSTHSLWTRSDPCSSSSRVTPTAASCQWSLRLAKASQYPVSASTMLAVEMFGQVALVVRRQVRRAVCAADKATRQQRL